MTDKCTGADIAAVINAAAMVAIKEHLSTKERNPGKDDKLSISMGNLKDGLQKVLRKAKAIQSPDII